MKNTLKYLFAVLALLAAGTFPVHAQQNTMTGTTLSAAVTDSATTVRVASATGITASSSSTLTNLYIDNELMTVISISGTTVTVGRGAAGTRAAGHISGAVVYAGKPSWFYTVNPQGSCTLANVLVTPYINVNNGNQWLCSSVLLAWVPGFGNPGNSGIPIGVTTLVASAAGQITPSGPLFHINGTAAITGFTMPVGGLGQGFCVIPDAAFTTTATNNIAKASTGVANRPLCWTWDGTNSKYTPTY